MASFLASGSIRIVVAGMFDGVAAPFLVYRDATILPSLCGGFGPVVHVGRQNVEHITDAAPAHAVGELSRNRALGGAGIGRHVRTCCIAGACTPVPPPMVLPIASRMP